MSEIQSYGLMFFIIGASFMWLVLKIISIVKNEKYGEVTSSEHLIRLARFPKPIKTDDPNSTPTATEIPFSNVKESSKTSKPDITLPARPTKKDKGLMEAKNPPEMPKVNQPKKETPVKKKTVKKKNVRK